MMKAPRRSSLDLNFSPPSRSVDASHNARPTLTRSGFSRRNSMPFNMPPQSSIGNFCRRLSAGGKAKYQKSNTKSTVAVILDDVEIGIISLKPNYLVSKVRAKLNKSMKEGTLNYRFYYADDTHVALENEANTRIESW